MGSERCSGGGLQMIDKGLGGYLDEDRHRFDVWLSAGLHDAVLRTCAARAATLLFRNVAYALSVASAGRVARP
jgi:hypothetical protein